MGKFLCSDQRGLDLNQLVQMTKMSQSCSVEVNKTWSAEGKPSQHWHLSYSHREVDTVYKVLNYCQTPWFPTYYFPQYMRYHSPLQSVFIFPLCLSELWAPFGLRTVKKCSISSSRKTTRKFGFFVLTESGFFVFFNKHFVFPEDCFACFKPRFT